MSFIGGLPPFSSHTAISKPFGPHVEGGALVAAVQAGDETRAKELVSKILQLHRESPHEMIPYFDQAMRWRTTNRLFTYQGIDDVLSKAREELLDELRPKIGYY